MHEDFLGLGSGGVNQAPCTHLPRLKGHPGFELQQGRFGRQTLNRPIEQFSGAIIVLGRQAIFDFRLNLLDDFASAFLFLAADSGLEEVLHLW